MGKRLAPERHRVQRINLVVGQCLATECGEHQKALDQMMQPAAAFQDRLDRMFDLIAANLLVQRAVQELRIAHDKSQRRAKLVLDQPQYLVANRLDTTLDGRFHLGLLHQRRPHRHQQVVVVQRLGQHIDDAPLLGPPPSIGRIVRGEEDHRQVMGRPVIANLAQQLIPIDVGHDYIGHKQIGHDACADNPAPACRQRRRPPHTLARPADRKESDSTFDCRLPPELSGVVRGPSPKQLIRASTGQNQTSYTAFLTPGAARRQQINDRPSNR